MKTKLNPREITTRKLINTNGNTEGITVGKKLKQSKKKWWHVIFTNGITDGINFIGDFVSKLIIDGICILYQQKNSVNKIVKSCSEIAG